MRAPRRSTALSRPATPSRSPLLAVALVAGGLALTGVLPGCGSLDSGRPGAGPNDPAFEGRGVREPTPSGGGAEEAASLGERSELTPPPVPLATHTHSTTYRDEMPADGVTTLAITCGDGDLRIVGEESATSIQAAALVESCATNGSDARRIASELAFHFSSRQTENPTLVMPAPPVTGAQSYRVDLEIHLPPHIRLEIDDGRGDIEVAGVQAGVRIHNSAGEVTVSSVRGGVEVTSSGESCTLREVSGLIQVQDGPGELSVLFATGIVNILDDAGALDVFSVTGDVTAGGTPTRCSFKNIDGDLTLRNIPHRLADVEGISGRIVHE